MVLKKRILTVSSANMDFVMNLKKIPAAGETLSESGSYAFVPGGKGANSAVAVSRLGGDSVFCTRLGNDTNGAILKNIYINEGIDTRFITVDPEVPTGLAAIMVEPNGQNRIVVYPGANLRIAERDVTSAMICRPDALLLQMEIAPDMVISAARMAHNHGIPIVIDAGPASFSFPLEKLPPIEIFSPNETETRVYTGISPRDPESCLKAAIKLSERVQAKYIVLKLGGRGCYIYDGKYYYCLPAYDVPAVDSTAAGDAFTAALALEYIRTGNIVHAGKFANVVGALTVRAAGAIPSIPTAATVRDFIGINDLDV